MLNCERCRISGEKETLYDVIYEGKIAHMCKNCANFEDLPVIRKTPDPNNPVPERKQSVYERMVHISGVKRDLDNIKKPELRDVVARKEPTLRDIVERNMKEKPIQPPVMKRDGVVNNYHWIIMRARRAKKVTQEQLANHIGVDLGTVAKIERGQLPDDNVILRKIEAALKIKLFLGKEEEKEYFTPMIEEEETIVEVRKDKPIAFDSKTLESLRVADLRDAHISGIEVEAEEVEGEKSEEKVEEETDKIPFWKKFKSIFKGKPEEVQTQLIEEPKVEVPEVKEEPKKRQSYRERQKHTAGMSKRDLSSKEINEMIFGHNDKAEGKK